MDFTTIMGVLPIIAVILLVIIIIATGYVKAPPDVAYIISGIKKEPRILIGRAGIKIPFLERLDKLELKQITIDIKTEGYIPTLDFINIQVDAVAKVKISTEPEMLKQAMTHFLNRRTNDIITDLQDSLQGNMREIVGTMDLRKICNDRNEFGNKVQESASKDMQKLGIEIISCNIQNVVDESDLIVNMGADNTAKIRKDASIAKAEAERDIVIKQAEANKQANDAKIASELEISQKNNELEIKKADLKREADTKKAEADAAYEIQQEEQRKTIEITKAQADIAREQQNVTLKQQEVAVKEQSLAAEIKKKAEADRFAKQQEAEAELFMRQKDAEAKKYELEQEAEGIRAKGLAEAEAIKAKALAEAEGIEKKAEAMQKYGEAAILEMFFKAFPEAVKNAAEPLASVDNITMYGSGNSEQMVGSVMNTVNQVTDGIKGSTGVDIKSILDSYINKPKEDTKTVVDEVKPETDKTDDIVETDFREETDD